LTINNPTINIEHLAFADCENLQTIIFNGSKAQWDLIFSPDAFDGQKITLICSDGTYLLENYHPYY
jgi:hypothetical protein